MQETPTPRTVQMQVGAHCRCAHCRCAYCRCAHCQCAHCRWALGPSLLSRPGHAPWKAAWAFWASNTSGPPLGLRERSSHLCSPLLPLQVPQHSGCHSPSSAWCGQGQSWEGSVAHGQHFLSQMHPRFVWRAPPGVGQCTGSAVPGFPKQSRALPRPFCGPDLQALEVRRGLVQHGVLRASSVQCPAATTPGGRSGRFPSFLLLLALITAPICAATLQFSKALSNPLSQDLDSALDIHLPTPFELRKRLSPRISRRGCTAQNWGRAGCPTPPCKSLLHPLGPASWPNCAAAMRREGEADAGSQACGLVT